MGFIKLIFLIILSLLTILISEIITVNILGMSALSKDEIKFRFLIILISVLYLQLDDDKVNKS